MKRIVSISSHAVQAILFSAIEIYPAKYRKGRNNENSPEGETFGLLFGLNSKRGEDIIFHVDMALSLRAINCNEWSVAPIEERLERTQDILEMHPVYEYLGTFHSHPWRNDEFTSKQFFENAADLSPDDAMGMCLESENLERDVISLVIGLTHLKQKQKKRPPFWRYDKIGNYWGKYKYVIAATYSEFKEDDDVSENDIDCNIKAVDNLICPFVSGINSCDLN